MRERLPDLGLGIKGVELQPEEREKHRRSEREHQRASESEREEETCCLRACAVNRHCVIAILRSVVCHRWTLQRNLLGSCVNILGHFHRYQRALLHCCEQSRNLHGQLDSTGRFSFTRKASTLQSGSVILLQLTMEHELTNLSSFNFVFFLLHLPPPCFFCQIWFDSGRAPSPVTNSKCRAVTKTKWIKYGSCQNNI